MIKRILIFLAAVILAASCTSKVPSSVPHKVKDGRIVLKAPDRQPGQESALQMVCEPMDTVRVGVIGLGDRGSAAVRRYCYIEDARITALCDLEQERVEKSQKRLESRGKSRAAEYVGGEAWKRVCESDDVDLVYICTPWQNHTSIAVYAMQCGKHVAIEVPAATSIAECWQLVDTSEKTRRHCIMLENCCYDFFEMTVLNMAQHGLFGDIVHVEGGYIHNLGPFWDKYHNNWRLAFNQAHKGDVYPTHGLGPLCQLLDIHRGDRMDYLVSMDTDAFAGKELCQEKMGVSDYANGDHTVTLIRTERGKQIEIQHNVVTRRPYDRKYQVTGTDGFACKYPKAGLAFKSENLKEESVDYEDLDGEKFLSDQLYNELMEKYSHPLLKGIEDMARKVGGHGGMDYIMDYRLIYCLRNGLPLDMDVYDAAEWSCLTELSGLSISYGSMPVEVPDFTRGDWQKIDGFSHAVK